jgi:hypothetical protein
MLLPTDSSISTSHFSRIESSTGAASPIERLMTPRTSAVAVCCSSASCVSLNSRALSSATPMLAAMVLTSRSSAWP